MPKLLLHIGLPKTATTSLQRNVLMPLHEQRRINLLGRCYTRDGRPFDPFGEVFGRIKAKPLSPGELQRLRPAVETMLDRRRLNVISKESISSETVIDDGTRRDSLALLRNLAGLFRGDDVTVLISLRSPVDRVLSAYVKGYRWRLYGKGGGMTRLTNSSVHCFAMVRMTSPGSLSSTMPISERSPAISTASRSCCTRISSTIVRPTSHSSGPCCNPIHKPSSTCSSTLDATPVSTRASGSCRRG